MNAISFLTVRKQYLIAAFTLVGVGVHLLLRYAWPESESSAVQARDVPLLAVLVLCGLPLVIDLLHKLFRLEFGSDLLAGMSIITAVLLQEYLAGALVVLMLSGGEALEAYAVRSASSVLGALARRMPSLAHRKPPPQPFPLSPRGRGGRAEGLEDVPLEAVRIGDVIVVFPHEVCPVDGTVIEGHGVMDESYLTGEPYLMSKAPGSAVLSGSINGQSALTLRADRLAVDSRYAKIMQVMKASEQQRPKLRRLGDRLGALYTPLAVAVAVVAWALSGQPNRFLAVLVVATPCPLLIAIPVAIIGSISLAARRGIIIKDPAILENIDTCRTAIFDKTGTLTYGEPKLTEVQPAAGYSSTDVLALAASLERYSKHPLAGAVVQEARLRGLGLMDAMQISEPPGQGLRGVVDGYSVQITNRRGLLRARPEAAEQLPAVTAGMECVIVVNERYAGVLRFRDEPRKEGPSFIRHLGPRHHFRRLMLVSGDRESEARYLAERVGIREVYAGQTPEQKLAIVREENSKANTVFLGDGINDAPALAAATVGIAFGQNSDITAEAAGAVVLESSLEKVDELMHIGRRMRSIALQSALAGMGLSMVGMVVAAVGYLPPVAGAVTQEIIDVLAVVNALRAALPPRELTDY